MNHYNILWTGGWDSTFRVLDLVINKKKTIQPYYVKDNNRKSTSMELATMDKIKELIVKHDASLQGRILDTIFIEKESVKENPEITSDFRVLTNKYRIGIQYDWLARFAEEHRIFDLELCIHKDDKAFFVIQDDIEKVENSGDSYYQLKDDLHMPEVKLFSYFHFPVLMLTKLDMAQVAEQSGFSHIMEETWFCHNPQGNKPCGLCNPCKYTRDEGLGRRVPNPSAKLKLKVFMKKVKAKVLS